MAWFLIEFIYLKHTPMRVTDTTQIQQAKRDGNLLLLAALLLLLLFYFSL
ncbi:hypothetical protein ACVFI8_15075 [Agarivorans sp. MS3-6]|nr:hypothetical protein [Agarivorans sp. TSD2052]UPW17803.1 hypothetical protein M0C34_16425 [Agarivorans sp. TSD2052]